MLMIPNNNGRLKHPYVINDEANVIERIKSA